MIDSSRESYGVEKYHGNKLFGVLEMFQPLLVAFRFNAGLIFWNHYQKMSTVEVMVHTASNIKTQGLDLYNRLARLPEVQEPDHAFYHHLKDKLIDIEHYVAKCQTMSETVKKISGDKYTELKTELKRRLIGNNEFVVDIKEAYDTLTDIKNALNELLVNTERVLEITHPVSETRSSLSITPTRMVRVGGKQSQTPSSTCQIRTRSSYQTYQFGAVRTPLGAGIIPLQTTVRQE